MVNKLKDIYLAIGDVHGCWTELNTLLSQLGRVFDLSAPNIKLIFLGDYIDRGDSSLRVLQRLMELQKLLPRTVFLTGNHEQMYLKDATQTEENDLPLKLEANMLKFLKKLPYYCQAGGFLFIHAGPPDAVTDLTLVDQEDLLWNYGPELIGWQNHIVVRGHCRVSEVYRQQNLISVDTGCCFGGKLSCAVLTKDEGLVKVYSAKRKGGII